MGGLTDASKFNSYNGFTAGSDVLENSPLKFNSMGWTSGKEFFTSFGDNDYFTPIRQLGSNDSFGFYYDSKNRRYQAAYKDPTGNLFYDKDIPKSILDQLSANDIAKIFEKGGYNQNAYETNFTKVPYSNWNDDAKKFAISDYIAAHFNPDFIKETEIPQTATPLDPVKTTDSVKTADSVKTTDPIKTAASAQGSSDLKAIQAQEAHPEWEDYQKPNNASVSNAGGTNDKVSEVSDTKSSNTSNTTQPIRDTKTNTSILDYLMADKMLQDDRTAQLTKDKDIGLIPMLLAAYGMGKIM